MSDPPVPYTPPHHGARTAQARCSPSSPTLASFRDRHAGVPILVCGCGASLRGFRPPPGLVTIGVNDVGRQFTPDYLVVVNPASQFKGDRFRFVAQSAARYVFSQLDLGLPPGKTVRFRLGRYGGTDTRDPGVLHYTQNSPYVAVGLAALMGASRIGLLGVDFTDGHFFGNTGAHPLNPKLVRIDAEYGTLRKDLAARGVELFNLSPTSRLASLPKVRLETFLGAPGTGIDPETLRPARSRRAPRLFFVHYRFLSCGDVFTDGLRHAAAELGVETEDAYWNAIDLPARIQRFQPDLMFVVHGRRFAQRWGGRLRVPSAVWLLDEPYEVDDTATWSRCFDHVFVNDPATLERHRNAHYLPTCYDPRVHFDSAEARPHPAGFVGGGNPRREQWLVKLAREGLLSYVVGGPWSDADLKRRSRALNLAPSETAGLYRQTRVVINIFRQQHHFNRARLPATSLNPRVYEALACGALVVSENRPELPSLFPELPVFGTASDLVGQVKHLHRDEAEFHRRREACRERLALHTYAARLSYVMNTCFEHASPAPALPREGPVALPDRTAPPPSLDNSWRASEPVVNWEASGTARLSKAADDTPGSEQGLMSRQSFEDVELDFEALLQPNSRFLAKLHVEDPGNPLSNSYHLSVQDAHAYLARQNHFFQPVSLKPGDWRRLVLRYHRGTLSLSIDGGTAHCIRDQALPRGHAFLGIKGGTTLLRNIRLRTIVPEEPAPLPPGIPEHHVLHETSASAKAPKLTLITTVYDRTDCLRHCLRSVGRLQFQDYEQIIVSDAPPVEVVEEIRTIVKSSPVPRVRYANLAHRANNWGIAPASAGLFLASGDYVAFLSDDNGYLPDHFNHLVPILDSRPEIGFVYSSCLYDGRMILSHPRPGVGRIDLGQPLFRRNLFYQHLNGTLPFREAVWDGQMMEHFLRCGVRFHHINRASFIFRLAKYPQHLV